MEQHPHGTPDELFDFLPADEELVEERPRTAEEQALHLAPDDVLKALADPALREAPIGYEQEEEDEAPRSWFDDEEPEGGRVTPEDETELDVEDVLVAQHYAFEEEAEEGEELREGEEAEEELEA